VTNGDVPGAVGAGVSPHAAPAAAATSEAISTNRDFIYGTPPCRAGLSDRGKVMDGLVARGVHPKEWLEKRWKAAEICP
jgi:hypothetical protein